MTKTGKPDSYWADVMRRYAAGSYKFSTGQKPKGKRWKGVLARINECLIGPSYPSRLGKKGTVDLLGNPMICSCTYHKTKVRMFRARSWMGPLA